MDNSFGRNIIPENDDERIKALKRYHIMDTPAEEEFDNIVKLATSIFKVPISLISLVDAERVFFKAGSPVREAPRGDSFCAMAISTPGITVIENALNDPCLLANPHVAGEFGLRFYAGAPLITEDNYQIGTICVLDQTPRKFTKEDEDILTGLSKIVMRMIAARRAAILQNDVNQHLLEEQAATNEELSLTNKELEERVAQRTVTLESLVKSLAAGEKKLDQIIEQLPASITVITGHDLIVERTNASNLNYWQKQRDEVIGRPLLEVLPELVNQPFPDQLRNVMETGEMIVVDEGEVNLMNPNGEVETTYVDYSYQAITDENGKRVGVLVMSNDVTGTVIARRKLEESEKALKTMNDELDQSRKDLLFTIDAAGLATFDLNPQNNKFSGNELLKSWFGLTANVEISLSTATNVIAEQDRERVINAIRYALDYKSGGKYDVVYAIANAIDPMPRIVHAKGQVLFNNDKQPLRLSGTLQDITEQKKDEQRKNDFIGMVSHELKTPLTSLTSIVQVANAKLKGNADTFLSGAMEKADVQVRRMSKMINGFLNVSRLESGKMLFAKEDFHLDELLREVIKESELTVSTHIIEINICDHVKINADRDKIGSVVSNLLSNAVKYSPKGKTIEVKCQLFDHFARISIKDQGIGINPQDKDRLFDRYYRVENPNMKHVSGFGIGLYLSAEIIRHHNGQIGVESEKDKGSTFYFTLPLIGN